MKLYTVYRITNLLNNKIYIGFHITDNINDSYMGSNKHLTNSIKKYGIENFKKETLFIFNNREDMINKEIELVNESFVKREDTYNKTLGGKGSFYYVNLNSNLFKEKRLATYQNTLNTTDLRSRLRQGTKEYVKNNPEKVKESNKKAGETRRNKSKEDKDIIRDKKIKSLKITYSGELGETKRKKQSDKLAKFYLSERGNEKRKEIGIKVKNSTFMDYIYNEYEEHKIDVLNLVINSTLLDKDIMRILRLSHSLEGMLRYYEKQGYVSNVKENRLNQISHPVIVKKYSCSIDNVSLNNNFIDYKYLREDYINLFLRYQFYILGNYCDSYIYNFLKFKNMKNVLLYMEYLGILIIEEEIKMEVPFKGKIKRATKTVIKVNESFKQNYKLIDKENYYEHSIESNFNGESFSISWNRL